MKLTMTARHMELSVADRQAIDRKLKKLERILNDNAISAQCVLWEQRGVVVCELTLHARHDQMLHGVARHAQLVPAVGFAVDKVAQQALKVKDRWTTRPARKAVRARRATSVA